jgi:septum site-determining protein MinC
MTAGKHHVTIKGTKDGLQFLLSDACSFETLIKELHHKLEKTHQQILTGPIIHVHVKLGNRDVTELQKEQIREIIGSKGNLLIQSIESSRPPKPAETGTSASIVRMTGIVRSGQTITHDGNLLFLGDVNPGGTIVCTGHLYVLGSMRGMAHAGSEGDESAIIAASHLRPTQLRIAGVISRPPDEWGIDEAFMEYAYIKNGKMEIDKLNHLHRLQGE